MVQEETVRSVRSELKSLLEESKTQRENHRVIKLMELLLRLTDLDGDDDEADAMEAHPEAGALADATAAVDLSTTHQHIANVFGNCAVCGQCLHLNIGPNGECKSCGEQVATVEEE